MDWKCEWCVKDPNDTPGNNPERCTVRFCAKCKTKTWHWPAPDAEAPREWS